MRSSSTLSHSALLAVVMLLICMASFGAAAQEAALQEAARGERMISLGKSYTYHDKEPSSSYPDTGGSELTDGRLGTTNYYDSAWVGIWNNRPFSVVVDLERFVKIEQVRIHHLAGTAGIRWPELIEVSLSLDGTTWTDPFELVVTEAMPSVATTQWFSFDHIGRSGRYVRVRWTPPAAGSNIFFSEIEVLQ